MGVIDITGQRFGKLLVVKRVANDKADNAQWLCKCDCGNTTIAKGRDLRSGHVRSCGCLQKETAGHMARARAYGEAFAEYHFDHRLRMIYHSIKARCYNPHNAEFANYGGKGITMCSEWNNDIKSFYFWAMKHGYKSSLTIDRIDNSKGYSPSNCRFASRAEQNRNTTRNNRVDVGNGETITTAEAARIVGVSRSTAARWFREEGLTSLDELIDRRERIVPYNAGRTLYAKRKS